MVETSVHQLRRAWFVSDLHLSEEEPEGLAWFSQFLNELQADHCQQLFILGDLFNYWVGPKQMRLPAYRGLLESLAALQGRGIELWVTPGNRDPFLEERFCQATGARLTGDWMLTQAGNQRILLTHGDLLCTRDLSYQRYRRLIRSRFLTWLGPRLPLWLSLLLARGLRRHSQQAVRSKLPEEKGIVEEQVKRVMTRYGAQVLICGHVHEQRDQQIPLGQDQARLLVLPAFDPGQSVLEFAGEFQFLAPKKPA